MTADVVECPRTPPAFCLRGGQRPERGGAALAAATHVREDSQALRAVLWLLAGLLESRLCRGLRCLVTQPHDGGAACPEFTGN